MTAQAIVGADIFDGQDRRADSALLIEDGEVAGIVSCGEVPTRFQLTRLDAGIVVPGFVDLQVNGGGGVLLNDQPDVATIKTICATHVRFGTTALLPTLITDAPDVTAAAIEAAVTADATGVPGFLGLHLEGPHLSVARKGAHDPAFIRAMTAGDLSQLVAAKQKLANLMVTVAPESVTDEQIASLAGAGVVISLGHTDATCDRVQQAVESGARSVTHLFNAMSQMGNREPGTVGAALDTGGVYAGLIADGFHVDKSMVSIAVRAKKGPGKIFLVTDAMSTIGTDMTSFELNGRLIRRTEGKLTLEDGTLAGADLDMIEAIRFMVNTVGADLEEVLRMAALYPARCMGVEDRHGHLGPGAAANLVHLDRDLTVESVWVDGVVAFSQAG